MWQLHYPDQQMIQLIDLVECYHYATHAISRDPPAKTFEWIIIIVHCCLLVWLTFVNFLETVNNGFLWYCIPWWYKVFHCLEKTNLWKRFVALHCFDTITYKFLLVMGFEASMDLGPMVEEQMSYVEREQLGCCSWGSWFQVVQSNCQKGNLSALSLTGWVEFSYEPFK